jgi:hypothetical protein
MRRCLPLLLVIPFAVGCGTTPTSNFVLPTPTPVVHHQIEYRATGRDGATLVDLTIQNDKGGTSQFTGVGLPWAYGPFDVLGGEFVYVSAQNNGDHGCVRVQVYRDAVLWKDSESCGAYVIATGDGLA